MTPAARMFGLTWLAYAGYYLCRKNFSVLMPYLQEHGHSKDSLASAIFVYSLLYSVGQFTMGMAADRFGARLTVTAGMLVSAGTSITMGWFHSPVEVFGLQALNGFAQACGWSGLLKIMTSWFPPANRGVVMGWWGSNYALGAFLATSFAAFSVSSFGGYWLNGAYWPGMLLGALGVLFGVLVREGPLTGGPKMVVRNRVPILDVAANPEIQRIAASYFCMKLLRYSFLFWLPTYLVERLGMAKGEAGYASSLYELVGFAGVVACGYVSEHWFGSRRFAVGALALFLLAPACLLPLLAPTVGSWIVIPAISIIGFLTLGPDTLMAGVGVQDSSSAGTAATAAGFVNGVGSVGQLISPFMVSQVVQRFGWDPLFFLFVLLAVGGGLILSTRWQFLPEGLRESVAS